MGRGDASASAQQTLDALRAAGTEVMVAHGDVTSAGQVAAVLESVRVSMPPLRGVVHAAGVLDDGILQHLDERQLRNVMAPKVEGAWNLHALTRDAALDFFVLISSASSLLGSPGAANYAAANAFLDALAWHRRAEGRPALSIDWGPWAGLGFSARAQHHGRLTQHGVAAMPAAECLSALTSLLSQPVTQVAVLDVDLARLHSAMRTPLLADLQPELFDERRPGSGLYDALRAAAPEKRQRLVEPYLRELVAAKLGLAPANLDIEAPLNGLGVDSLITLELRIQIERDLGVAVPVARVLDGPSVASLSGWLADQLSVIPTGTPARSGGAPAPPTTARRKADVAPAREIDLLTQVSELSDEAVEELLEKVLSGRGPGRESVLKEGSDDR
jgi:acyl carrier protein